jgi:putative ATP-binding cassette transporter
MRLLTLLLRASVPLFAISVLTSVFSGVSVTMLIREIHQAVGNEPQTVNVFLVRFALLIVIYLGASMVASYTISELTRRIVHNLRIDLSTKIIQGDYASLENRKSRLLPVLTDDISTVAVVIERLPSVANGIAMVIGILVYMIILSPFLSLATIGAFVVIIIANKVTLHFIAKYSKLSRESTNEVYRSFEGLVNGLASLKMNRPFRDSFINQDIVPGSEKQTRFYLYHNVLNAFANRINDVILFLFLGAVILAIIRFDVVSMEFFNQYLTLVLFMLAPLATITGFLSTMKKIEASVIQITNLGITLGTPEKDVKTEISDKFAETEKDDSAKAGKTADSINDEFTETTNNVDFAKTAKPVISGSLAEIDQTIFPSRKEEQNSSFETTSSNGISLENVLFRHKIEDNSNAGFTLGPISHTIPEGRITFISGGNGSGKTTLIKLICGLYSPLEGTIRYRGIPITADILPAYRDQFAIIFTDNYTFNHLLHIPTDVLEKRSSEMLELVGLTGKVTIKNGRFSDVNLSEGQKKRLVLVSALLEDKPIYVFDEWVAYQDQVSRNLFFNRILPWLKERGKTVINIAHDAGFGHIADENLHLIYGEKVQNESRSAPVSDNTIS